MSYYRYTLMYGLTGKFYECIVLDDKVRLWDVDQHITTYMSRSRFAARLRDARVKPDQSVARYDIRPDYRRPAWKNRRYR